MKGKELPFMYAPRTKDGVTTATLSNDVPLGYAMEQRPSTDWSNPIPTK